MNLRTLQGILIGGIAALGGIAILIAVITGSKRFFEESDNPRMQDMIERFGKTKIRITYAFLGILMTAFGLWLLHGVFFVTQP